MRSLIVASFLFANVFFAAPLDANAKQLSLIRESRSLYDVLAKTMRSKDAPIVIIVSGKSTFSGKIVDLTKSVVVLEENTGRKNVKTKTPIVNVHYIAVPQITSISMNGRHRS